MSNNSKIVNYLDTYKEEVKNELTGTVTNKQDLEDGLDFDDSMAESDLGLALLETFVYQSLAMFYDCSEEDATDKEVEFYMDKCNISDIVLDWVQTLQYAFIGEGDFESVEDIVNSIREEL